VTGTTQCDILAGKCRSSLTFVTTSACLVYADVWFTGGYRRFLDAAEEIKDAEKVNRSGARGTLWLKARPTLASVVRSTQVKITHTGFGRGVSVLKQSLQSKRSNCSRHSCPPLCTNFAVDAVFLKCAPHMFGTAALEPFRKCMRRFRLDLCTKHRCGLACNGSIDPSCIV
jgi:hypothetical protein